MQIFECFVKNFDNIQMVAISGKNEKMKNAFTKIVEEKNKDLFIRLNGIKSR